MRPHDPIPPGIAYPVDPWTGFPLKPVQQERMQRLRNAAKDFRQALHDLSGTTLGSPPGDPRMAMAFQRLGEALMWAQDAVLDREGS